MASLTAEIVSQTVFGRNLGKQAAERVIEGFAQYQTSIDNFNLPYWLGADDLGSKVMEQYQHYGDYTLNRWAKRLERLNLSYPN